MYTLNVLSIIPIIDIANRNINVMKEKFLSDWLLFSEEQISLSISFVQLIDV